MRCFVLVRLAVWWLVGSVVFTGVAWAAGSGGEDSAVPTFFNIYQQIAYVLGLSEKVYPFMSALLALAVIAVMGLRYRSYVRRCLASDQLEPKEKFSLESLTETIAKFIYDLSKDLFSKASPHGTALIASLFLFVLVMNLSGLIPFLPPGSGDFSANLGIGLSVFVVYHVAGIRAQGFWPYIKHFSGPKVNIPVLGLLLPILIFVVEIISHSFRPVSLSLRLMGNIFGDHMLVGVFTGMVTWFIPSLLLFFGVLVSIVQAFVFSLLSGIYLSMAVSEDH
ncbi:MAG: F0F1 ATP synthase subunit A [Proteobacteria bacterium]|nr:F0F1 ATP synthase subunit A [Pseudomonadota bacterium]